MKKGSKKKIFIVFTLLAAVAVFVWFKFFNVNGQKWRNDSGTVFTPKSIGYDLKIKGSEVTVESEPGLIGTLSSDKKTITWNNGFIWRRA